MLDILLTIAPSGTIAPLPCWRTFLNTMPSLSGEISSIFFIILSKGVDSSSSSTSLSSSSGKNRLLYMSSALNLMSVSSGSKKRMEKHYNTADSSSAITKPWRREDGANGSCACNTVKKLQPLNKLTINIQFKIRNVL